MDKIKVLAVADPAVDVYVKEEYKILENYNKDIEVVFDIVSWDVYFDTMLKSFDGKSDYDIVMVAGHLWLEDFVEAGHLAQLDYDFEDILPVIAEEMQCRGKTYLSPSFCDGHMIVYDKTVLQDKLNSLPDEVISVDEFYNIVEKLHLNGIEKPLAIKACQSEIFLDAIPYLRSSDVDAYTSVDGKLQCNIQSMKKEIQKYMDLKQFAQDDSHNYGNEQIKYALAKKEAVISAPWSGQIGVIMASSETPENFGFSTFDTAWNVTWSFAVVNSSKNKENAQEFLAYLRSKEVDLEVGRYCGAPVRKSTYVNDKDNCPWYSTQLKMIEDYAKPLISSTNSGDRNNILYQELYNIFMGEKNLDQGIEDIVKAMDLL